MIASVNLSQDFDHTLVVKMKRRRVTLPLGRTVLPLTNVSAADGRVKDRGMG